MLANESIVRKLVLVITVSSAAIFAVALGYNYMSSRAMLEQELESNARNLALSLVNRVEIELSSVAKTTEGMARAIEIDAHGEAELLSLLRGTLEANPGIYGSTIAFEPYAFSSDLRLYAPYLYRRDGQIEMRRLESSYTDVPYFYWDWYQIPRELEAIEWTEPYFDEGAGNILISTCSVPFYDNAGGVHRLRGIVTTDVSLDSLTKLVSSVRILKTGYAALLSRNGVILAHPLTNAIMNESFFSIAEARKDDSLRSLGKKMVRGESGFVHYQSLVGVTSWMYYAPIRSTGWTLAVVFPETELLASVKRLTLTMVSIGLFGVLLLTAAVASIATSITRPLRSLAEATHVMSSGDFDVELPPIRSKDEVGRLANDFRLMRDSLKQYVLDLTETTAAKERIQSELRVATEIQASLLPRTFPPFPERPEFEIFAAMDPAKEVGGDFYDFFFVDPDHLCFLIADVTDKGVPAALYMMVAKTLLKSEGQRLGEPDRILASVNGVLAEDNERCMFASVLCAILDVRSGEVRLANAGHNPPLLSGADGVRYLRLKPGPMLGPSRDAVYHTERLTLRRGETLFLYTDGVTEATSPAGEPYGELRLSSALQRIAESDPVGMIHHVRAEVLRHAGGAPQSDDVTMVAIKYRGPAAADNPEPRS
jgi:sigma-B regulation protein RsbU (phosphoserine phosphatase)